MARITGTVLEFQRGELKFPGGNILDGQIASKLFALGDKECVFVLDAGIALLFVVVDTGYVEFVLSSKNLIRVYRTPLKKAREFPFLESPWEQDRDTGFVASGTDIIVIGTQIKLQYMCLIPPSLYGFFRNKDNRSKRLYGVDASHYCFTATKTGDSQYYYLFCIPRYSDLGLAILASGRSGAILYRNTFYTSETNCKVRRHQGSSYSNILISYNRDDKVYKLSDEKGVVLGKTFAYHEYQISDPGYDGKTFVFSGEDRQYGFGFTIAPESGLEFQRMWLTAEQDVFYYYQK
jgi:hypothetical protein